MERLIDSVNLPEDVKKLNKKELKELCTQIREFLIEVVSKTGGHLASNLGVVELTVAIHRVFDMPKDKIVFDVGHQSYVHKMLTGRKDRFDTLRQEGGLSGFPKRQESVYDSFDTGHSSTSVSAALGLARARDLKNESYSVIALIGDGALTGGLAYEALMDAGNAKNNLIVILNDNQMSVSKNVGAMSVYLSKIRTRSSYSKIKNTTERFFDRLPFGDKTVKVMKRVKDGIKNMLVHQNMFEDLGFTYLGPVDGHDIEKVSKMLIYAKKTNGPVLVHVCTKKGCGYEPAEKKPQAFHGISRFDVSSGNVIRKKFTADYSAIFGRNLAVIARENEKVVAISPAMTLGSGLKYYSEMFPKRFFDVGICEAHAVTSAAGLAVGGFIPVVSVYSSFLQRAYDQIIHDVAMQKLHVVFCIDRAGCVGDDGETHQGAFDIAFMRQIPGMAVLAPANFYELAGMLRYAVLEHDGPICIRYPRGNVQYDAQSRSDFEFGKSEIVHEGSSVTVACAGPLTKQAAQAAKILEEEGISAEVINLRSLEPIDEQKLAASVKKTGRLLTIEDGVVSGGVGEAIGAMLARRQIECDITNRGYTQFVSQAKVDSVYRRYGLDSESICAWARDKAAKKAAL